MYTIGICGYGYVGKGMHRLFKNSVTAVYTIGEGTTVKTEFGVVPNSKEEVNKCDMAIVCVPTPMAEDGHCDTSIVEETVKWLKTPLIIIKSTIEPGTTDRLIEETGKKIAFSPEYMGEGKYFTPPWKYPDPLDPTSHGFMVIGGEPKTCEDIIQIFIKQMGVHTSFTILTAKEAECVKYWENMWGAMKVIFANQMYDCLKALGVNYYATREGWAADPRVELMHSAVFEKARGFSGKCYPKDLRGFIHKVEEAGFNPTLLKEIWNINCDYRPDEFKKIK
jgi:nucleotide sugar dehydrogenase